MMSGQIPFGSQKTADEPVAIVSMECALPGVANLQEYEQLLIEGLSGLSKLNPNSSDLQPYYDLRKGVPGKTYTCLGGWVPHDRNPDQGGIGSELASRIDPVHLKFCQVAMRAWNLSGLAGCSPEVRTGVFVGHSGATRYGGDINFTSQIVEAIELLKELSGFQQLPEAVRHRAAGEVVVAIQQSRPQRSPGWIPRYQAATAANLVADLLQLTGPRLVVDAACASSLFALHQAIQEIRLGRLDAAIVGGATANSIDNLILFSQSQACSATGSAPFDQSASGLVSSEGYAAVVIARESLVDRFQLHPAGWISGLGIACDGRGKSLWAPRAEGQQLAVSRAYSDGNPLNIDYLEAHATSTQLGDATELTALTALLSASPEKRTSPLLIGSAKSNLGHTLETAGLSGLIKVLIAMRRGEIPASLNYKNPNQHYDWSAGLLRVVDRKTSWPASSRQRQAAVSAFGIGGLNAHLVVADQKEAASARSGSRHSQLKRSSREPIAIVGRGVVLPGAFDVDSFRQLLLSGKSVVGPAPEDRWRAGAGVDPATAVESHRVPTSYGGYIQGYQFDGQPYRIPPKQVKQANPIQMMLLDAVTQACNERDGGSMTFDHEKTGVVIGTVFGGEFGNQLQVGLRLPEILSELKSSLRLQGVDAHQADTLGEQFQKHWLASRPALLDETGGFTASTLASRIAKTFNLMGGACAVDAGEASSLAALGFAIDQLQTGVWESAICGTAQRSMDLSAFEQLDHTGKLVRSGRVADIPDDCSQVLPGEGVAVVLLQRLSDAMAAGVPVFGVIEGVECENIQEAARREYSVKSSQDAPLARQIGYLAGSQDLVRMIKSTLQWADCGENADRRVGEAVECLTLSEESQIYRARCYSASYFRERASAECGEHPLESQRVFPQQHDVEENAIRKQQDTFLNQADPFPGVHFSQKDVRKRKSAVNMDFHYGESGMFSGRVVQMAATSHADFAQQLQDAISNSSTLMTQAAPVFTSQDRYRLSVLAESPDQLRERLQAIAKKWAKGKQSGVLEAERAILWDCQRSASRVAWLYPGQGSFYTGVPAVCGSSAAANAVIDELDAILISMQLPAFRPMLEGRASCSPQDIWQSQIWTLGVSVALTAALKEEGHRPDVILGHSFGEYAALVATGSLSLQQCVRLVKARADAVVMSVRDAGQLVSILGSPSEVEAVLRKGQLPATITHYNAPRQTVIGVSARHLDQVKQAFAQANLATTILSVPVAYHTERLQEAERILENNFSQERFLPPVTSFLSTTTARYAAEPNDLKKSLTSQLTRPVLYVPVVERLIAEDCALLIEVGPDDVLSRLNQRICGDQALCLSWDLPGRDHAERQLLLQAALEAIGRGQRATSQPVVIRQPSSVLQNETTLPPVPDVAEIIDLRKVSRRRKEKIPVLHSHDVESVQHIVPPSPAPVQANEPSSTSQQVELTPALGSEIRDFLKRVVIDLTGYHPDVVDLEADLEADLGVDSIKKAQVVGELADTFGLSLTVEGVRLGDFRSLEEIAVFALSTLSAETVRDQVLPTVLPVTSQAPTAELVAKMVENATSASAAEPEFVRQFLVDLVVDQTGYSPEVVDLDADLEADLGIDSIKQAQLFGEIQTQFHLPVPTDRMAISSFSTLRAISDYVIRQASGGSREEDHAGDRTSVVISSQKKSRQLELSGLKQAVQEATFSPKSLSSLSRQQRATSATTGSQFDRKQHSIQRRGVEAHDAVPEEWKQLFRSQLTNTMNQDAWQQGALRGQAHRDEVRATLRLLIDLEVCSAEVDACSGEVNQELQGLAAGAGVAAESVLFAHGYFAAEKSSLSLALQNIASTHLALPVFTNGHHAKPENHKLTSNGHASAEGESVNQSASVAAPLVDSMQRNVSDEWGVTFDDQLDPRASLRFALRLVPAPQRSGMPKVPRFRGAALVVGDNKIAQAIRQRFEQEAFPCYQMPRCSSLKEVDAFLNKLWEQELTPHLFLTTPHDAEALRQLKSEQWNKRRLQAIDIPYRICQLWMQRMIDENVIDRGSAVVVANLGGDFGFSGKSVVSPEGGLGALLKAMTIEGWMRGHRSTPMKVLDLSPETTPHQAVEGIWRELAVPTYDAEISLRGNERWVVQPFAQPMLERSSQAFAGSDQIQRGGNWVVTGGARGITAVVSQKLAQRHGLKLHLVGTAPAPMISDEIRRQMVSDRSALRRHVMKQAAERQENGMEAWRQLEKAIEIDATLQRCRELGIEAEYYSCDVGEADQVRETLAKIRARSGAIRGVIHGAGIGQDARFDRKRPDKVAQCLGAKIDGCLHLMDATRNDPLDWFVAFGSISGRFGANGHTDYSLANDMMAKLVDRYRTERPEVRSTTFHWHAWGDIGMATKPETQLALKMINLEFMPAEEGIAHFLNELEQGGNEPEVLITDRAYYRKFYPAPLSKLTTHNSETAFQQLPLLFPEEKVTLKPAPGDSVEVTLSPQGDRFLSQHLIAGQPTLPFVTALELMAEAARWKSGQPLVLEARNVVAEQALKWGDESERTIRLVPEQLTVGRVGCRLQADLFRRDGRLVAKDRTYFEAEFLTGQNRIQEQCLLPDVEHLDWETIRYLPEDAAIYHGPDLQCLQRVAISGSTAYGQISASSTIQLAGGNRPTQGWSLQMAVMDACLYAAAVMVARQVNRPSLPVRFDRIRFGRLPDPGEPCLVTIHVMRELERGQELSFQLAGHNADLLLDVQGYQIGWIH